MFGESSRDCVFLLFCLLFPPFFSSRLLLQTVATAGRRKKKKAKGGRLSQCGMLSSTTAAATVFFFGKRPGPESFFSEMEEDGGRPINGIARKEKGDGLFIFLRFNKNHESAY